MKIESQKHSLDVRRADLSGSQFADVDLAAATIDGIAVTDLLDYWRVGHGAKDE
jgi:hypothetical protein